ncbi:MAG TPA: S8 family serine peptidase [Miltoncostaeaceae bacterium]|nr:S8 family serine peptidase [Miltoncostaeaceae bacterium]
MNPRAERHERSTVASFSSAGPTVDGRQKPELVAPAVALPVALPGRGPDGRARVGELTGTSAAAAEVAARAAALRAREPRIGPRRARALLIASAQRLPGVASTRQGAGEVGAPDPGAATVYPPIIQVPEGARAVRLRVNDRGPAIGTYVIRLHRPHAGAVSVTVPAATARRGTSIRVPAGMEAGHLTVSSAGRRIAAAPVFARRAPTRANVDDLGTPAVRTRAGGAQIMVRIGRVNRVAGRIQAVALNDVRFELVPLAGGSPLTVLGTGQSGSWPAGTYRFLLADRDADGIEIPRGMYRLRVSARHPGGGWLRRASAPLRVR